MKEVFQAIYNKFNTDNDFYDGVSGQLYPHEVDQENASYPCAAYFLILNSADWTFAEDVEYITVQFSIYSDANSSGEVLDLYDDLKDLFDDAALTVTGYPSVKCHRDQMRLVRDVEESTWHLTVDYEIELQRERS